MAQLFGSFPPIDRAVARGGAAGSPIDLSGSGIAQGDSIMAVRHFTPDLVTNDDVTSEASIPRDASVQLTTTNTTGDYVAVLFMKASG